MSAKQGIHVGARAAFVLAMGVALMARTGDVRGDGAWVQVESDNRGHVVAVVPRQHTTISMQSEAVALVPFYDGSISKDHPLVYVNVRYAFENPGSAETLHVGFPEVAGRVTKESYEYAMRAPDPKCGDHTGSLDVTCPSTIETFFADADGKPLHVTTGPGTDGYARWFLFDVPFVAQHETLLRNRYVARLGYERETSHVGARFDYEVEYILHTGGSWSGPIGEGDVGAWDGGWKALKHFVRLRPTQADDVHARLGLTETSSRGRPLFLWDYGNGRQVEGVLPHFEKTSVVHTSSSRHEARVSGEEMTHFGAMALDRDRTTAWVDEGAAGGIGEWLEVPTGHVGRVRALEVVAGDVSAGVARIKRLQVACFDLTGNDLAPIEVDRLSVELADQAGEQRVILPRALAECHSIRFTIEELFGGRDSHGTIAELGFVAP